MRRGSRETITIIMMETSETSRSDKIRDLWLALTVCLFSPFNIRP
jgi:hypothetical protein